MKKLFLILFSLLMLVFSTTAFAESCQKSYEISDRAVYVDTDSVARLNVPDLTVPADKNGLMYTVKVIYKPNSDMYAKYHVKSVLMKFNTVNNIDGRNYRLTESLYFNDAGNVIQKYGKTAFDRIVEGSMGEEVDKIAKEVAVQKGI